MTLPISLCERSVPNLTSDNPMILHESENYVIRNTLNHLGIMGICAYYRLKDKIDISYSSKADFSDALNKIVNLPPNSIFGTVYNFKLDKKSEEVQDDFSKIGHCTPIIFFKNSRGEIGIFSYDGLTHQTETIFGQLDDFIRQNESFRALPISIFMASSSTQLASYGCQTKSVEDCKILLTLDGIEHLLEEQMLKARKDQSIQKSGYYNFKFPEKLYRVSEETKFVNRRTIKRALNLLNQTNSSEDLDEIDLYLVKDRSPEIDSLKKEMVSEIEKIIQKIKEMEGLEPTDTKYKDLLSEKNSTIKYVEALIKKADEILGQKFGSMIVSKNGASASEYFQKHIREVRKPGEKYFNLILIDKASNQIDKVHGMFTALGSKVVMQEMAQSYANPTIAQKYIDGVLAACNHNLKFVTIADWSKEILAHLSNEPIVTESIQQEPQKLSDEDLERRSPSFKKAYDLFAKQQENDRSQEIDRKPERKKPTALPKTSSMARSSFACKKLKRKLPEIPKSKEDLGLFR